MGNKEELRKKYYSADPEDPLQKHCLNTLRPELGIHRLNLWPPIHLFIKTMHCWFCCPLTSLSVHLLWRITNRWLTCFRTDGVLFLVIVPASHKCADTTNAFHFHTGNISWDNGLEKRYQWPFSYETVLHSRAKYPKSGPQCQTNHSENISANDLECSLRFCATFLGSSLGVVPTIKRGRWCHFHLKNCECTWSSHKSSWE